MIAYCKQEFYPYSNIFIMIYNVGSLCIKIYYNTHRLTYFSIVFLKKIVFQFLFLHQYKIFVESVLPIQLIFYSEISHYFRMLYLKTDKMKIIVVFGDSGRFLN